MNEDTMARDMTSLAMDVHEFSTVVIKFYKSFMVNELHELFCDVFFVCLSRFLSFIYHHAHDLIEEFYAVVTLFRIQHYALMLRDFSGTV